MTARQKRRAISNRKTRKQVRKAARYGFVAKTK